MKTPKIAAQVARDIRTSIDHGIYEPGRRLPGERQLAEEFFVSRSTVRSALEDLAHEGRIVRSAQRGWFVPSPTVGEPPSTLQSFTEMARLRGLTPTARVLEQITRSATIEEAEVLGIPPGAEVLVLVRLRCMNSTPICVDNNIISTGLAGPLVSIDLTDRSLYETLVKECSVAIYRSAYSVQAEAASVDTAQLLNIPTGSPVLIGREVAYDRHGNPLLIGYNTYRGDAYRFEADLYRSA